MAATFTIVIPTYNRALMLPAAIRSVTGQTFKDWEMIIVDDGSSDNTKEVVSAFLGDSRIKYLYQTNAERSAARNNGIAAATGQYICFLDSDDYYLENRLELLYREISSRSFPVEMFYTGLKLEREGVITNAIQLQQAGQTIFDRIATSVIHSQQVCVHRSILRQFKYDLRFYIGEDMELWLRIAEHFPFNYLDNQYTIVAVDHDDRSVNVKRNNSYAEQLRLFKYIFVAAHPGSKISQKVKTSLLASCYFGIGKYYIYNNRRMNAARNVARSIFADLNSEQLKFKINVLLKLLTFASMQAVRDLIKY